MFQLFPTKKISVAYSSGLNNNSLATVREDCLSGRDYDHQSLLTPTYLICIMQVVIKSVSVQSTFKVEQSLEIKACGR